ncbi:MAG: ABC transporter ATP-binding protein [Zestosphaera sp.]
MVARLQLRGVWFRYSRNEDYVLRGVDLELRDSELAVITGPNGSGKTTLILVAAGLLKPEAGEVLLDGRSIYDQLPLARRRIGVTFQNPDDQFFNATVYDEIAFALRQLEGDEGVIRERVAEVARRLRVEHLLSRPPYRLSGGEKTKVALAAVLIYNPEILLLDEPTAYLTRESKEEVLRALKDLKCLGRAVAITTNDPEVARLRADKTYTLANGMLYQG